MTALTRASEALVLLTIGFDSLISDNKVSNTLTNRGAGRVLTND